MITPAKILAVATDPVQLAAAHEAAQAHLPGYPRNGCGTLASCVLRAAGLDIPVKPWAEDLADTLKALGWQVVSKRAGKPGDVGVSIDGNGNQAADHIWVVVSVSGDTMRIVDNQATGIHPRSIAGKGKTPTDYFLRCAEVTSAPAGWKVVVNDQPVPAQHLRFEDGRNFVALEFLKGLGADVQADSASKTVRVTLK